MARRGLGIGKGKGYYNLVPRDSYIHRLSANGVSTANAKPTLAQRFQTGIKRAVEWEKANLPKQKAFVEKELDLAKQKIAQLKADVERKKAIAAAEQLAKETDQEFPPTTLPDLKPVSQDLLDKEVAVIDAEFSPTELTPEEQAEVAAEVVPTPLFSEKPQAKPSIVAEAAKRTLAAAKAAAAKGVQLGEEYVAKRKEDREYIESLSDTKLAELAVRNPPPLFGRYNKFESELISRQKRRVALKRDLREEVAKEAKRETPSSSGLFADLFSEPIFPKDAKLFQNWRPILSAKGGKR